MHGNAPAPNTASRLSALDAWRTPAVIVACGCLIAVISYGPRSSFGFFMKPMTLENGWGRDVFAFSVAMQTLIYGMVQPFSGAIADRFGTIRVIIAGALLYAGGVYMMAHATTPGELYLTSGVLIGFGLTGCSFNLIISSFGKLLPESWRSLSFGAGTAAGSFGQFLFSPLGVSLIDQVGWRATLEIFAGILLLIIPLSLAIATPRQDARSTAARPPPAGAPPPTALPGQSFRQALAEAFGHRSFILLVTGYFTCRPRAFGRSRRLDAGRHRAVQHRRRARLGLSRRPHAQAFHPRLHLFLSRARDHLPHHHAGHACRRAHLRRGDRALMAVLDTADVGSGRGDVRHPLACDAGRRRLPEPSDRRLARRLSRRPGLRADRLLRHHLVGRRAVRRAFCADQPADRGEAGAPAGGGGGMSQVHLKLLPH
jgi:hypothetical protein